MTTTCFLHLFVLLYGACLCALGQETYLTEDELQDGEATLDNVYASSVNPSGSFSPLYSSNKYEGDIILPEVEPNRQKAAVRDVNLLWPGGQVPYIIDSEYNRTQRIKIAAAFVDFKRQTCIEFVPRTTETAFVHIANKFECSSMVGNQHRPIDLSLGESCFAHGVIIHELLHVLGFYHEQSRTDRDDHVSVVWENIHHQRVYTQQFDKYEQDKIQHLDEPYDYGSVMHYKRDAFSKNGKDTIIPKRPTEVILGQDIGFSLGDIRKVNKLYSCTSTETWNTWNSWSTCSLTCGSGMRTRIRSCSKKSQCLGQCVEREFCSMPKCVSSVWNAWSAWSECSTSCNGGYTLRLRTCDVKGTCGRVWDFFQEKVCNDNPCDEELGSNITAKATTNPVTESSQNAETTAPKSLRILVERRRAWKSNDGQQYIHIGLTITNEGSRSSCGGSTISMEPSDMVIDSKWNLEDTEIEGVFALPLWFKVQSGESKTDQFGMTVESNTIPSFSFANVVYCV